MQRMARVPGVRYARTANRFDAFDSLPREIRDAVNYATANISAASILAQLKVHTVASVLEAIRTYDKNFEVKAREQTQAVNTLAALGLRKKA